MPCKQWMPLNYWWGIQDILEFTLLIVKIQKLNVFIQNSFDETNLNWPTVSRERSGAAVTA